MNEYPQKIVSKCLSDPLVEAAEQEAVTLTWQEFWHQMYQEGILLLPHVQLIEVVIRGEDGDYGLVAVHRDGERFVFDLGKKLKD